MRERIIETLLFLAAVLGVLTTVGIVVVLAFQTLEFFQQVSPVEFFTGTKWSAGDQALRLGRTAARVAARPRRRHRDGHRHPARAAVGRAALGIRPPRIRNIVKPILETIAGIPTIVLGFFAINFLAPNVLVPLIGKGNIGIFSALSAGIVVGLLVTPLIASISEDAMRAVPRGMREGAYAMGATKFEVVRKVVFPAALSGIMASIILAMSRAIGETMVVVLAAGDKPQLTFDPTESVQTMTAFIAQIAIGETAQGSVQFKSLFAVAVMLFVMTLVLNLLSGWVVRRYRTAY